MTHPPMHLDFRREDGRLLVWCKSAAPHCWVAVVETEHGNRLCGYCMADISERFKRTDEAAA